MNEHRFEAMGCEVVVGGAAPKERRAAERLFEERERLFSRFRPGSELSRVNGSGGKLVTVSPLFAATLAIALRVADQTEGLVDPTLGAALESAGYDRDFSRLDPSPNPPGPPRRSARASLHAAGRLIRLAPGVKLDLNGVVKALAVDDALALLRGEGFVSAGGDVAARGELTVALPGSGSALLRRGALATSGSSKRRWLRAGTPQHHLIDPATGRPADSPWLEVTACGATCLAADAAAKAAFLLGERGPAWLDERRIPARFLRPDGEALENHTWAASMEAVACT